MSKISVFVGNMHRKLIFHTKNITLKTFNGPRKTRRFLKIEISGYLNLILSFYLDFLWALETCNDLVEEYRSCSHLLYQSTSTRKIINEKNKPSGKSIMSIKYPFLGLKTAHFIVFIA